MSMVATPQGLQHSTAELPAAIAGFDAQDCRTAVHAIKALELWLEAPEQQGTPVSARQCELDFRALVLGRRQINRLAELLVNYGWQALCLKSQAPVTCQLAQAAGFSVRQMASPYEPGSPLHLSAEAEQADSDVGEAVVAENKVSATLNKSYLSERGQPLAVPAQPAQEKATLYLKSTLRSGQAIDFDGTVVLLGDAHHGSEILATGDILVWGELRGLAHAGRKGNRKAQIRALRMDPLQLRIADLIARRPDKWLQTPGLDANGGSAIIWSGEVAVVYQGEIQVFPAHDLPADL